MKAALSRLRGLYLLPAGLCCVLAVVSYGQSAPAGRGVGWSITDVPSAKELAQSVDRHYNNLRSLKAGFTENYQGLGTDRTESGTLLLLKPGRMRWDYSSPAGKLFLLDGKYAWSYTKGDAQAERIPAKDLNDLRSPLRYLLGHAELAKELNGLQAAPAANGRFTLSGVPKGMESRVERLTLTVTADGVIDGITIKETDDAVTQFTFTGQQPNAPVPSSIFHFAPPAGVQVQDSMAPI
ncbi:MAG TPA: outer membrane lipoprotein carrier protein LolA [Terracidiphilus sp.]|nr:outer membrane lipoprotein carrier protein LolA [Terracidiphilus sp.]